MRQARPSRRIDITGQRFGRLRVTAMEFVNERGCYFSCECDCGTVRTFQGYELRTGHTTSCGCYGQRDLHTRHGAAGRGKESAVYTTWLSMKQRCLNPRDKKWPRYGGRGIRICDRWLGERGFENFRSDMGDRPSPQHSIDRIDNDGNYEPSNCRWATNVEQIMSRSTTKLTIEIALSILEQHGRGESASAIARSLRLSNTTVGGVIRGRSRIGRAAAELAIARGSTR